MKYNKHNCQSCIRRVSNLDNGLIQVKIIVSGQHAHKWSVTVIKRQTSKSLVFPGRILALKEHNRLLSQFKQFGDVSL